MNFFNTKHYYYFPGNLTKHLHFFEAVRDACNNNGVPTQLITFLRYGEYKNQIGLIKKNKTSKVIVFFYFYRNITAILYFFFATLFSSKTIIHFKKTQPAKLYLLKNIFKNKLIFITSLEGDTISEKEFLRTHSKNSIENKDITKDYNSKLIDEELLHLEKFDFIFVQNDYFRKILEKRHTSLANKFKISHLMSFKKGKLFYNENIRATYRSKLEWDKNFIITYIGNVYYPWQNIVKTIKLFKRINKELYTNSKLLLLINKEDHELARNFLFKYGIKDSDYCLMEVSHSVINSYLNAADLGIVLRDFHDMNKVVTSGKLLDYLGSGLPVITTSVLTNISDQIQIKSYGLVLDDLEIDNISMAQLKNIIERNVYRRNEISTWANNSFSLDAMIKEYIVFVKKLKLQNSTNLIASHKYE